MTTQKTFYLSQILGKKFFSSDGEVSGKIRDLLVDLTPIDPSPDKPVRPKVIAVKVRVGTIERVFDFSALDFHLEKRSTRLIGSELEEISKAYLTNVLWLKESILYRQIVDIHGRRLKKVWDIRLVYLPSGTYAIAVDVGLTGWLRRLGLQQMAERICFLFGIHIPVQQILWDDIESVDVATSKLFLSKSMSKLSELHPSDLADIIEDLDKATRTYVFTALNEEQAADVLEEMQPDAQVHIIESLSLEKAADLLEKMDADEVADILDELEDDKAEMLLKEMEKESSEEVRELMEYTDNEVGSIMNREFFALSSSMIIGEAINILRKEQPEPLHTNSIFITDKNGKLVSSISLAELIIADPSRRLEEIMTKKPIRVFDTDKIDILAELVSKYNLLSIPVINEDNFLEGMVLIEDIVDDLLGKRKTR